MHDEDDANMDAFIIFIKLSVDFKVFESTDFITSTKLLILKEKSFDPRESSADVLTITLSKLGVRNSLLCGCITCNKCHLLSRMQIHFSYFEGPHSKLFTQE